MVYIYILYSETHNRYYVGMTENIEQRLTYHNEGQVKSTKAYKPWRLVRFEKYKSKMEARVREKYLKSAAGRWWRNNNLGM
ncbi:MAG: GIY-YIG nuclease family protein [Flavobacteriaceae bacterium]|nr:GIY-YIG nuclease family protein [Bacteroidia bacterium]MBT8288804.1 GIY-YIG nuclease family protein [Bacteroidia bacterium]NNF76180.1 GIY-YIG nuclease family protein [Flavobacteriaceae bacterium]NNK73328.1 GIY-YIG nuclease family protein [Flavobacteriaceae bacterium]